MVWQVDVEFNCCILKTINPRCLANQPEEDVAFAVRESVVLSLEIAIGIILVLLNRGPWRDLELFDPEKLVIFLLACEVRGVISWHLFKKGVV